MQHSTACIAQRTTYPRHDETAGSVLSSRSLQYVTASLWQARAAQQVRPCYVPVTAHGVTGAGQSHKTFLDTLTQRNVSVDIGHKISLKLCKLCLAFCFDLEACTQKPVCMRTECSRKCTSCTLHQLYPAHSLWLPEQAAVASSQPSAFALPSLLDKTYQCPRHTLLQVAALSSNCSKLCSKSVQLPA